MAATNKSEEVLAQKFDKCVADTLIKTGGGLVTGAVFSLLLFKRKAWPLIFGMGTGAGMGYANCQQQLNQPYLVLADRVKVLSQGKPAVPMSEPAENAAPSV